MSKGSNDGPSRNKDKKNAASRAVAQRRSVTLPAELKKVLPAATVRAWETLAPLLPKELYLGGGTAVAVHLHHRESRDLDFFNHGDAVDLEALAKELSKVGQFAVVFEGKGTLRGYLGDIKVEFFHADEGRAQQVLEQPRVVVGVRVAGLKDLLAMKLKVVGDRGECAITTT